MKKNILPILAAALIMCACGTSKKVADTTSTVATSASSASSSSSVSASTPQKPAVPAVKQFVSDLDITIAFGKDNFDLGGRLSARRGDVARINLTYMGFVEVATIEFTPSYLLFVNRMGKQYTKAGYKDLDVLVKNNITFETIQEQIWSRFDTTKGMAFDSKALSRSLENLFNANVKGGSKASININIGEPDTKREFSSRTEIKSTYKEIPADVLFSTLSGMMK